MKGFVSILLAVCLLMVSANVVMADAFEDALRNALGEKIREKEKRVQELEAEIEGLKGNAQKDRDTAESRIKELQERVSAYQKTEVILKKEIGSLKARMANQSERDINRHIRASKRIKSLEQRIAELTQKVESSSKSVQRLRQLEGEARSRRDENRNLKEEVRRLTVELTNYRAKGPTVSSNAGAVAAISDSRLDKLLEKVSRLEAAVIQLSTKTESLGGGDGPDRSTASGTPLTTDSGPTASVAKARKPITKEFSRTKYGEPETRCIDHFRRSLINPETLQVFDMTKVEDEFVERFIATNRDEMNLLTTNAKLQCLQQGVSGISLEFCTFSKSPPEMQEIATKLNAILPVLVGKRRSFYTFRSKAESRGGSKITSNVLCGLSGTKLVTVKID